MAIDLTGITNENEFYTHHYLSAILENDLKDVFKEWKRREQEEAIRPPYGELRSLAKPFFAMKSRFDRERRAADRLAAQREFLEILLQALGYPFSPDLRELEDGKVIPILGEVKRPGGGPVLWILEAMATPGEEEDPLEISLHAAQVPEGAEPDAAILEASLEDLITRKVFGRSEPPRWVLLTSHAQVLLLDRSKWNEKRLLRFDLGEIFDRREPGTFQAMAALLHRESVCPAEGLPLLDNPGRELPQACLRSLRGPQVCPPGSHRAHRERSGLVSPRKAEKGGFYRGGEAGCQGTHQGMPALHVPAPLPVLHRGAPRTGVRSHEGGGLPRGLQPDYTPEVLTQCLVKYALKELLEGKSAEEILQITVCEPAMGSAAFLNEAVNQLAEAYLKRKQQETGRILPHDQFGVEKQKVKMFLADNNVFGVDLNPVAVELAEVSLWLNTIFEGAHVPWFGMQLVTGNSLIGAGRRVFASELLMPAKKGDPVWLDTVPTRILPGEKRTEKSVYHFLVGDRGMANYADKVVKGTAATEFAAMNQWRKDFNRPFNAGEVAQLQKLSREIDRLWERHAEDRRTVWRETLDFVSVWLMMETGLVKSLIH